MNLFLFVIYTPALSQISSDSTRQTVITSIRIQDIEIPHGQWNSLVLAQTDTITFTYGCISKERKTGFLFRVILRDQGGNERIDSYNTKSLRYSSLAEQKYIFLVQAFAPSQWESVPAVVEFKVNNAEALQQKLIAAKRARDSVAKDSIIQTRTQHGSSFILRNVLYWIIALILSGGILVIVLQILKQRKRQKDVYSLMPAPAKTKVQMSNKSIEKENSMSQNQLSYEQLLKENGDLRAEIAALRGQIEALQVRTTELQKTNKDLSDQKERLLEHKKQLEELQTQKDELFSMVVHDMKNPAGLVRGLVELLRSYDLTAQEQQEIMEDLMATSTKILSLAQEVSRIVTLESGVLVLDVNSFPMTSIVEDVCRRNNVQAISKNIELIRDYAPGLPDAEVDVQKIEEVLDNLVSNAIKFSHKGSTVKVKAYKIGELLIVEVIDHGLGLTESDIKRAFGRGARLSAKPTAGEPSSGLGLWIVKKIIEAHHGRVWVKSSMVKGSTFAFEIPLVQPRTSDDLSQTETIGEA